MIVINALLREKNKFCFLNGHGIGLSSLGFTVWGSDQIYTFNKLWVTVHWIWLVYIAAAFTSWHCFLTKGAKAMTKIEKSLSIISSKQKIKITDNRPCPCKRKAHFFEDRKEKKRDGSLSISFPSSHNVSVISCGMWCRELLTSRFSAVLFPHVSKTERGPRAHCGIRTSNRTVLFPPRHIIRPTLA